MSLLDDLEVAERATAREVECPLCAYINQLEGEAKVAMERASAGTIGVNKLAAIMGKHKTGIGRRTIERHRREEHTP